MRRWIEQPPEVPCCGQVAVAVVAKVPVTDVVAVVGHSSYTKTRELAAALRHFGFDCPERCRRMRERPALGIGHLTFPGYRGWHWVAAVNGRIYDGVYGEPGGGLAWPADARVTSWLPVEASV